MESSYRNTLSSPSSANTALIGATTGWGTGNNNQNNSNKNKNLINLQFDVATIVVRVTDVNDHAPEFRPGSCYPLAIPENSDFSIIHTVIATDLDEGANGDISYSIIGEFAYTECLFVYNIN